MFNASRSFPANETFLDGDYLQTNEVRFIVNLIMFFIAVMIIIFIGVQCCLRIHYKAKTEQMLEDLRARYRLDAQSELKMQKLIIGI
ncbi:unnamed protein product [Caenorhabditis auriculariae]|uniref:Uncharacterized protein n=1 Tax=Caenorhabditis auriculariae TaxID=2777116 RepID=A0A8S1HVX4_9PELO|nr:unnamed protein product [Caenorhabditis auriculariae]